MKIFTVRIPTIFLTYHGNAELLTGSYAHRVGLHGKRVEHRVLSPEWLYAPILLNNAPFDFIFGVDKLYVFVRESPMMIS